METTFQFKKAVPVWIGTEPGTYNHLVGFYGSFCVEKEEKITLYVAARSYYRVYVNQELLANGPARTAAGYCRVDRLAFTAKGRVSIAVEVLEADKPEKYSNDCTLEKGMLCLEAVDEAGNVLLASGEGKQLSVRELRYRICDVELMSHSRGIIEFYRLTEDSCRWRTDGFAGGKRVSAADDRQQGISFQRQLQQGAAFRHGIGEARGKALLPAVFRYGIEARICGDQSYL